MNLSQKASEFARVLTVAGNGAPMGRIAAIDPDSGEYYVGDTVAEAVRNGRVRKSDPKAIFFVVRVGSPTRHALRAILVGGKIDRGGPYLPAAIRRGALIFDSDSTDVEAYELDGEKLIGMEAMAQVAPKLGVDFLDGTVALTD